MIIVQPKGLEHFRELKKNALRLYHMNRHGHIWEDCIKEAMQDYVRLLEEEQAIMAKREEIYNNDEYD